MSNAFLIVNDELHVARLLEVSLKRTGHSVECALSGEKAIKLLQTKTFNRVILDYAMPGMNGYDVLKFIRTHSEIAELWVSMMVSQKDFEILDAMPHRANEYLVSP